MAPKSTPKPTPRRSENDLETDTPKTYENDANFDPPNHENSLKNHWFLMIFDMSPILQMMPNMTQKWCPNRPQNPSKIVQKSIRKPMHNLNASWHRFLIDFGRFWVPRRASKSTQNRLKIDLGRHWRPQGRPRPTQDPPKTLPRPKIDPKSTQNRSKIHPTSTQHRPNIYAEFTCRSCLK